MPIGIQHKMMEDHDFPEVLVSLIDFKPYQTKQGGVKLVFTDSQWKAIEKTEWQRIAKPEAQCWLAL